ncbi:XrtA system polysaccharide deacetylase [Halorubellus litoreus]|uniref:XrtA system polysaccharide deacetylase n=1 Tax=Halorubellus litoreus TaxID=755308 RepID=A0ABD5VBK4_9EURY
MNDFYMTVDVEDWFHTHNLEPGISRETWDDREFRAEKNTRSILEMFEKHDVTATFFVLGWVAERAPDLIRDIEAAGHEVASHGYGHELLYELSREELRADLEHAHDVLSDLVDQPIRGYRAPAFSITERAIQELERLGYTYDSSSHDAVVHDRYRSLDFTSDEVFVTPEETTMTEAQLSTIELLGRNIPWAGGGWFRFIPYKIFRRGVERISKRQPYIFYIHPWELDTEQPSVDGVPLSARIRHRTNISRSQSRLDDLLSRFDWKPLAARFGENGY